MLDVLGCKIHFEDRGTGSPILFLHGNPDSSQMWNPIVSAMSTSYRCIAPDFPGYGYSKAPDDFDYRLAGHPKYLEALFAALDFSEPVHVVAHDFGGISAAAWMANYPQRFRSFTVSNSAFSTAFRWHFWARVWRTPMLGEFSMLATNRLMFGLELRRGSRQPTRKYIDATYALYTSSVKRTVLRLYRAVRQPSFVGWEDRYQVAARAVPVLVLWGEADPYVPDSMVETFHARKIVRFPGAGHWLPAVEPNGFSKELSSFLSGVA